MQSFIVQHPLYLASQNNTLSNKTEKNEEEKVKKNTKKNGQKRKKKTVIGERGTEYSVDISQTNELVVKLASTIPRHLSM